MQTGLKFEQALAYAARVHRGQLRKGTAIPYVSHLLAVTAIALEHGASETEAIGALLHDAAEDVRIQYLPPNTTSHGIGGIQFHDIRTSHQPSCQP